MESYSVKLLREKYYKKLKKRLLRYLLITEFAKVLYEFLKKDVFYGYYFYHSYSNEVYEIELHFMNGRKFTIHNLVSNLDFILHSVYFDFLIQLSQLTSERNITFIRTPSRLLVEPEILNAQTKIEAFKIFVSYYLMGLYTMNKVMSYIKGMFQNTLVKTPSDYERSKLKENINLISKCQKDYKLIIQALLSLRDNQDFYKFLIEEVDTKEIYRYLLIPANKMSIIPRDIFVGIEQGYSTIEFFIASYYATNIIYQPFKHTINISYFSDRIIPKWIYALFLKIYKYWLKYSLNLIVSHSL